MRKLPQCSSRMASLLKHSHRIKIKIATERKISLTTHDECIPTTHVIHSLCEALPFNHSHQQREGEGIVWR